MRYSSNENTVLVGNFPTGATVSIKIIDMLTDELVTLTDNVCTESAHIEGMYLFNTGNIISVFTKETSLLFEMSDGTSTFYGKFVCGGYINLITTFTKDTNYKISDTWKRLIMQGK